MEYLGEFIELFPGIVVYKNAYKNHAELISSIKSSPTGNGYELGDWRPWLGRGFQAELGLLKQALKDDDTVFALSLKI